MINTNVILNELKTGWHALVLVLVLALSFTPCLLPALSATNLQPGRGLVPHIVALSNNI